MSTDYRILPKVNSPDDLKSLDIRELEKLASEIREFIIDTIFKSWGSSRGELGRG